MKHCQILDCQLLRVIENPTQLVYSDPYIQWTFYYHVFILKHFEMKNINNLSISKLHCSKKTDFKGFWHDKLTQNELKQNILLTICKKNDFIFKMYTIVILII